ncbi:MAG: cell wall-binding repeat-containing protein, partial [Coriobacteriales bacterium]|nr:cell wall-binding repeat-containing protein [Coriobacteriales bacterium]
MATTQDRRTGRRALSLMLAFLMALAFVPAFPTLAFADPPLAGGETITVAGIYQLAANATGTITIEENLDVTLVGNGAAESSAANVNLNLVVKDGTTLTLEDVYIKNYSNSASVDLNVIDIQGDVTINTQGTVIIDRNPPRPPASPADPSLSVQKSAIHVPDGSSVTFTGDASSTFYLYKYIGGLGIGSDSTGTNSEKSGAITFASGTYFIRGSQGAAVIGNDSKDDKGGDVTVTGGTLYVTAAAMGAAIGGSSAAKGVDVNISGGQVYVFVDWNGPAFGTALAEANASTQGTLTITGGSLKTVAGANTNASDATNTWGIPGHEDFPTTTPIKSPVTNGTSALKLLKFDASIVANLGTADIKIDGVPFYSGGLYTERYAKGDSIGYLPNYFVTDTSDTNLYFFVPEGNHAVTVNDELTFNYTWDATASAFVFDTATAPVIPWNLDIDTAWYNTSDTTFEIATARQLAGLAAIVNGAAPGIAIDGFAGKTVKLTADIALNDHAVAQGDTTARAWVPIGNEGIHPTLASPQDGLATSATTGFAGTFDGQGHVVQNIYFEDGASSYAGLFGVIQPGIVIKNLGVSGYIESYRHSGGIAGLTGAGTGAQPLIENCFNAATTVGNGSSTRGVGGIIGTIVNAVGITVKDSYNVGTVTNIYTGPAGGIIGVSRVSTTVVENCYNVGTVSSQPAATTLASALLNVVASISPLPAVTNSYWLEGSAQAAVTQAGTGAVLEAGLPASSATALKQESFLASINAGANPAVFVGDKYAINNGYPILAWQLKDPTDEAWKRLFGNDRYDTMKDIVIGSTAFTRGTTNTIIVATGENFPDALAATGLAGITDAPVVLTAPNALSTQAKDV